MESAKVGKRGAIIVPAKLRKRFGIEEGSLVTAGRENAGHPAQPWSRLRRAPRRR